VNWTRIDSENDEYQVVSSLKSNRAKRRQRGEAFIEGIESIKRADSADLAFTRIVAEDRRALSLWARDFIEGHPGAAAIEMKKELYRSLCDREEPSEIVATARVPRLGLSDLRLGERPLVLVLDRPSDHGNFGSIVRSAEAFGADAVLTVGHGVDPFEPKAIRASMGCVFHARIACVESMEEFSLWIEALKASSGARVIGTDSKGDSPLASLRLARPAVIVMGNEAKGMSVALKELCDAVASIPVSGAADSLNVACAASIFLWEAARNGD